MARGRDFVLTVLVKRTAFVRLIDYGFSRQSTVLIKRCLISHTNVIAIELHTGSQIKRVSQEEKQMV